MGDSQADDSNKIFSVRIVSIDYYMAPPIPDLDISYSSFQGGKVNEVPVIRVYGSTPAGQKTCLHIHRALPYFYVPCSDLFLQPEEQGDACTHALSLALEKVLKLKGNAGSKRQHVHGCSLVQAKKFYGYHSSEDLFVKIYLYHPQDVSRAANLLLGGTVLDKVLQPHESHIPFLLQFLVDYNLYGMGHLHVSKLKFRNPIPDSFCQRKIGYNGQQGEQTDNSACMAAKSQADLGGDLPIWISSTIPDGWIWQYPSQPDCASDQEFSPVKRQSTSELEGDAIVEEILNQQFISYTSLSQTHSEMKMVPSLMPIWEEFEKSGMQAAAVPPDPGKPLPEDVMRTLSNGLELGNMLMEFSNDVKNYSFPKQSTNTSANEENLVEPGHLILEGDGAKHHEDTDECPMKLSADQLRVFETMTQPDIKPSDQDALRLLKWLASSQAAEDINSDDELARETILSPLLPATTFHKVLEKANIDYESESQQECQDILDSVEVGVNFEESNRKASHSTSYRSSSKSLSTETIPQVDGSSDDLSPISHADKSSKLNIESKISPEVHSDFVASNIDDRKRKRPQWGSLPVSSSKRVNDSSRHSSVLDTVIGSDSELKDSVETCDLTEKKAGKCHSDVNASTDSNVGQTSGSSVIVECSMRDLMRRKRSYRVEPPECRTTEDGEHLIENERKENASHHSEWRNGEQDRRSLERKEDASLYSEWRNDEQDRSSLASFIFRPLFADEQIECHGRNIYHALEACHEASDTTPIKSSCMQSKSFSSSNNNLFPSSISKDELHSSGEAHAIKSINQGSAELHEHGIGGSFQSNEKTEELPKSLKADNQTSTVCTTHGESYRGGALHSGMEPFGMTFYKKPPKIEWGDETCSSSQITPDILHDEEVNVEPFDPARVLEECLPFFSQECHEELEFQNVKSDNFHNDQELVMGVPIHYQNDGSYLYMLTPVLSPPSIESVTRWLSSGGENILKENMPAVQALPSPKGSNTDLVDSQGSQPDVNGPSLESASLSNLRHNMDNEETSDVKKSLFPDDLRRAEQNEGNSLRCEPSVSYSEDVSQISGPERRSKPTPLSQMGFRDPANVGGGQQLVLLSIEIHAESRGDLRPDPRFDAVNVIVLIIQEDDYCGLDALILLRCNIDFTRSNLDGISGSKVFVFSDEKLLFSHFIKTICSSDPDILLGWDIQRESLGFLAERAAHLGINLVKSISRTPSKISVASEDMNASEKVMLDNMLPESASAVTMETSIIEDEWGRTHASGVHVGGRIVLNVWRLMRGEVKLNFYTLEAVAEAVLRRKVPAIPCKVLTKWFSSGPGRARYRCIEYIAERARLNLQIMNQLDMINRTSELARVFGIDFFSVLSRGSQYRVESMFLRLAHTQNYLAISPGNQQVAFQPAMECLPLVMEPESGFYADPVVVLDFQSLYPSMIIAYNLCFCTCLGKVAPSKADTLGVSSYSPDRTFLEKMKDEILLTPNGVMYVPSKVRKGVLPRLLEEILSTRIMVKQAMKKLPPSQQVLHRIFDARQLALKLIANVTYGYTAAGFSGRMPCAELADSIVQCARRTLENAISFVNTSEKWQAKVIYGDTDSMFVLLKGRSVKESFQIGHEIAAAVTAMNPYPVTLKMEKVYHPCFLLTKKRYVGYSYESSDQSKPKFDAKGIETVRRDTCGAVAKMMEQSLRVFFEHKEIDRVKAYILRQWKRILSGRVPLQDFVFAKEVRLGTYSARPSSLPPAAIVASKAMRADPRAEPLYAERVPYVVVHGEPGARLVDMVVDPQDLLAIDSPYRLNDIYYIRKQIIPALQRAFGLVGADLNQWFLDMPRPGREAVGKGHSSVPNAHRTRIEYYYLSKHCIICDELVQGSANLCHDCSKNESTVATALTGRTSKLERDIQHLAAICRHCGGGDWLIESGIKCTSLACSVYYERRKIQKELRSLSAVATEAGFYPRCMVEWF